MIVIWRWSAPFGIGHIYFDKLSGVYRAASAIGIRPAEDSIKDLSAEEVARLLNEGERK